MFRVRSIPLSIVLQSSEWITPSRQLSTYTWRVCHWSLDSRSVSMHAGRRCMNDEAMDDGIGIMSRSMYDVSPN